ncbi:GH92 family glycosyl hydrolase [Gynurincola endophyticus]|uniref:GH92 family glycosyl hydrolase n=1 Tax=Gynurincola endophyticus TaxID=2479004 RepID=UPI000F8F6DE2|nr:GH92 family glycosyl hydrolase [Gynurincola endophyticus]
MKYVLSSLFIIFAVTAIAGTDNIAPLSKVTVSTELNDRFKARNAVDGIIAVDGQGEWACEGVTTSWGDMRYPWIQFDWDKEYIISRIVLYDRVNTTDNIAGGKLIFSDGSEIYVRQIPANGFGKEILFPAKKVRWVKFLVTDGNGSDLGFSEVEIFTDPADAKDFVAMVDPFIETSRGRYFFFTPGGLPFGMASAAPHTRNKNQNGGGYNYNEEYILGFGQWHDWMISGLNVMPAIEGEPFASGEQEWKSYFKHDDEIAQPGYHRLFLRKHKIWAEYTSTERVNYYRFQYTEDQKAQIILGLSRHLGSTTMTNAEIHKVDDYHLAIQFSSVKRFWGGPKEVLLYAYVAFDKKIENFLGINENKSLPVADIYKGDTLNTAVLFNVKAGEKIQMKIGLSYTSVENAKNNLLTECAGWDFDQVRNNARTVWNSWLGKIEVKGGELNDRIKFYTDLWHVLLGRHSITDVTGDYPDRTQGKRDGTFTDAALIIRKVPKNADGSLKFQMYNSDAFWLTQWNLNVLWGLAWPEVHDEMAASMMQYATNGYKIPRGPSGGGYSYIMTSSPSSNLVMSAVMKGILTKQTVDSAYAIVKRNAMPGGMLGEPKDIEFYSKHGYWPDNAGITLEAAFQDWGISQFAKKIGKKKDEAYFFKRSQGWKKLFDDESKFIFPKDRQGNYIHKEPLNGHGWVEANAWQATWGLSHSFDDLIPMMGGADSFTNKLNYAFEKSVASDYVYSYSNGYVSYANQPGCSNAHVFTYAGKPWLTQYWVRRVKEQAYGGVTPDLGYGGHDEDQGQMGGVSALMAIGLFNVLGNQSIDPYYEITSPIFDEIIIHLDKRYYEGNEFIIKTYNNSKSNPYIQRAALNGQSHSKFWFSHETFQKGGMLELWLDSKPNYNWGKK